MTFPDYQKSSFKMFITIEMSSTQCPVYEMSNFMRLFKNQIILNFLGYGHSTPATKLGKVFTISYACLGIPIAMIMFQVYYYCYVY